MPTTRTGHTVYSSLGPEGPRAASRPQASDPVVRVARWGARCLLPPARGVATRVPCRRPRSRREPGQPLRDPLVGQPRHTAHCRGHRFTSITKCGWSTKTARTARRTPERAGHPGAATGPRLLRNSWGADGGCDPRRNWREPHACRVRRPQMGRRTSVAGEGDGEELHGPDRPGAVLPSGDAGQPRAAVVGPDLRRPGGRSPSAHRATSGSVPLSGRDRMRRARWPRRARRYDRDHGGIVQALPLPVTGSDRVPPVDEDGTDTALLLPPQGSTMSWPHTSAIGCPVATDFGMYLGVEVRRSLGRARGTAESDMPFSSGLWVVAARNKSRRSSGSNGCRT